MRSRAIHVGYCWVYQNRQIREVEHTDDDDDDVCSVMKMKMKMSQNKQKKAN